MESNTKQSCWETVAVQYLSERTGQATGLLEPVSISTSELHLRTVNHVIEWMHEQLTTPVTLQDMADVTNFSPYYFSRIFSRITHISPFQFLAALRLQYAKQLLLTTTLNSTDICFELGYSSLGTFTSHFTKAVGVSPARFRRFSTHPTLSGLDALQIFRDRGLLLGTRSLGIMGQIAASVPFSGVIFIGLYSVPIPYGSPVSWAMQHELGPYHIPSVPDGCYWIFAAAFPWSDNPKEYLLPQDQHVYVGASQGQIQVRGMCISGSTKVWLRRRQLIDPPILSALPMLLNQHLIGMKY